MGSKPQRSGARWLSVSAGMMALILASAIAVGVLNGGSGGDRSHLRSGDGHLAAAFSLPDLRRPGEVVELRSLRGQPVVVNFWASWCVPCRREMRALEAAHRELGDRVAFVGVNHQDSRTAALALLDETDVSYPSGRDPSGDVALDYGLRGLPSTVFVAPDGELLATWLGPVDTDGLVQLIEEVFSAGHRVEE